MNQIHRDAHQEDPVAMIDRYEALSATFQIFLEMFPKMLVTSVMAEICKIVRHQQKLIILRKWKLKS